MQGTWQVELPLPIYGQYYACAHVVVVERQIWASFHLCMPSLVLATPRWSRLVLQLTIHPTYLHEQRSDAGALPLR